MFKLLASTVSVLCVSGLLVTTARASEQTRGASAPITNSPAARQTTNSSTVDRADASADLSATNGNAVAGQLRFTAEEAGVHVIGTVTGLPPDSRHGIHIHESGDCSAPDASSAGGHFKPLSKPHGAPGRDSHIGDLGNIAANHAGVAYVDVLAPGATLGDSAASDISGRAVIVHAGADDLKSQPSGDSGARIACGVIAISDPA
ncbi:MAG: superoxide dismutase family protein [Pseudomonadota bacterium]|nr:superoxide dismutase family protein [Pseudomonadota bacterium]